MQDVDENFYDRADAHIDLANEQIDEAIGRGKVSASVMYSIVRFNAWVTACGYQNAEQMSQGKEETIEYFMNEYRKMLEENLDNYIANFDSYMQIPDEKT